MSNLALAIHVERTTVPDVLRWVCRRIDLDATPVPPRGSRLEQLVDEGVIDNVVAREGDLLVRLAATTPDLVAAVHDAVVEALRESTWRPAPEWTQVSIRATIRR